MRPVLNDFNARDSEMNFKNLNFNINFIYKPLIALDNIAKDMYFRQKRKKNYLNCILFMFWYFERGDFFYSFGKLDLMPKNMKLRGHN